MIKAFGPVKGTTEDGTKENSYMWISDEEGLSRMTEKEFYRNIKWGSLKGKDIVRVSHGSGLATDAVLLPPKRKYTKRTKRTEENVFQCSRPGCDNEVTLDAQRLAQTTYKRAAGQVAPFCSKSCVGIYAQEVRKQKAHV